MTDTHEPIETSQNDTQDSPNPVLVIFLLIPLLGIIAALLMVANDIRGQQAPPDAASVLPDSATNPAALVNFAAPEFELNDLSGNTVSISDYEGKILFLNFWQTTCPPCIEEMPDFLDFIEDQPEDVTWLTVNFGENETMVREFFAAYDFFGIPVVMDNDSAVRYQYGVYGAPVTFVLDKDGVIQYMNIGQLSYDDMVNLVDSVRNGAWAIFLTQRM